MTNHNFTLRNPFRMFNSDLERESHNESFHVNNGKLMNTPVGHLLMEPVILDSCTGVGMRANRCPWKGNFQPKDRINGSSEKNRKHTQKILDDGTVMALR